MGNWFTNWLKKLGGGSKPAPMPPVVTVPPVATAAFDVVVRTGSTRLPGVLVRLEGFSARETTDMNGWVRFAIPVSVKQFSIFIDHPGYQHFARHGYPLDGLHRTVPYNAFEVDLQLVKVAPVLRLPELSISGKDWRDRGALYVPRWVSMLSALRPARTEDDWKRVAEKSVELGFNGVRVFAGALTWAAQTAPDARRRLPKFLDCMADLGLAVEVTALTDSRDGGYEPKEHARDVAAIVRGRKSVVLELVNELGHGTQSSDVNDLDTVRRWGQELCGGIPWAIGATLETDEPSVNDQYPAAGGNFCTVHLDRGRDFWNQARRVREILAVSEVHDCPALNNEPLGADERDGSETGKQRSNEPAFFFTLGALDRAFRGVGGVHHSTAGLNAELPGPVQTLCAKAYVRGHLAVNTALEGREGQYRNSGGQDSPAGRYTEEQWASQITRHYSSVSGGIGASIPVGRANGLELVWANDWRPVKLIDEERRPQDGKTVQVWSIAR